jgi:hypothetical protein
VINELLLKPRSEQNRLKRRGLFQQAANTTVDVSGDLALRSSGYTAGNGNNDDIAIRSNSFIRITGPTASFTITGVSGGVDGKIVVLYNSTAQTMRIAHDVGSSNGNRIFCQNGAVVQAGQYGIVKLIYSSADSHWIVLGTN